MILSRRHFLRLEPAAAPEPPGRRVAAIAGGCLSLRAVTCRVCGEHCEAGAIRFRLERGGVAVPRIDAAACTGCGACVAPCPARVVTLAPWTEDASCA